jgi:hydroxymethylglutaryl-CoA reductase (NADPH)
MCDYWKASVVGAMQSGAIGANGHYSNGLAALFIACGQDAACVSEASVGITRMEMVENRALYVGVTLPALVVGTVGGGTRMPTARECLRLLDCEGEGRGQRLAEICAATVLAGEISIVGALSAGDFARAHERFGRPSPPASK